MWLFFAVLSSVFAALTSILAKVGIEGSIPIWRRRCGRSLCSSWPGEWYFSQGDSPGFPVSGKKSWIFLILSGLATGASWLCYYKALQMGDASKVVPIDKMSVVITLILAFVFLHESVTPKTVLGCVLIGAGTLLMVV